MQNEFKFRLLFLSALNLTVTIAMFWCCFK